MGENFCKSDKGTVSRIYEESLQLTNKKTSQSIKPMTKGFEYNFFPRECI